MNNYSFAIKIADNYLTDLYQSKETKIAILNTIGTKQQFLSNM